MRIQPRIKQKRVQLSPKVVEAIETEVTRTARRFNVSRSWVVAVALGESFGIDVVSYEQPVRRLRRVS